MSSCFLLLCLYFLFFFFKQKTAYEMRISDWSSDVCSSDLLQELARDVQGEAQVHGDLAAVAEAAQVFSGDVARLEQLFSGQPQRQPLAGFLADRERRAAAEQVGESLISLRHLLSPLEERNAEFSSALERAEIGRAHV